MNKKKYSVLIGNGINNVTSKSSWSDLIDKIGAQCQIDFKIDNHRKKNFPILYEEIFLFGAKKHGIQEMDIKRRIAEWSDKINPNDLHERIRSLQTENIITTNYDFNLEGEKPVQNEGVIRETRYSIFRKYRLASKNFWHIHGDCLHTMSINLGFEHYMGQAQNVRNYVTTGTNYQSTRVSKLPLVRRLEQGKVDQNSWIDLFFTSDIHIIGLTFDFIEIELWWLLTYRARLMMNRKKLIRNDIYYYIPKSIEKAASTKLAMLRATGVTVKVIDKTGKPFYDHIFDQL